MKFKQVIIIILIIIMQTLLTGCWGKKELSEYAMVVAMGLDKDSETGEFIVTNQVVKTSASKKEVSTSESLVQLNTTTGRTIFEALRNAVLKFDRKQYYAHCKIIVIDEALAKEGIMSTLDMLTRSYEIRDSVWLVIAKQSSAKKILSYKRGLESVQGLYLNKLLNQQQYNIQGASADLLDFVKKEAGEGINPIIGTMIVKKEITSPIEQTKSLEEYSIVSSGLAVFKKDKLLGYLDSKKTSAFNFVVGKVKSGIINVPSPGNEGTLITLEIKHAKSKITPQFKDGEISFNIDINIKSNIVENQGTADISRIDIIESIEEEQKKIIESEINSTIDHVQNEYASDIFGFGTSFSKKYPDEWKKIKNNWDEIFSVVKYTVKVKCSINQVGVIQKPVKAPIE